MPWPRRRAGPSVTGRKASGASRPGRRPGGRTYLFYSANRYSTARYATGYAICATPVGPCRRASNSPLASSSPLLATGGSVSGPGGPAAFVDTAGRLRLAYAAWDRGRVGYPKDTSSRGKPRGCNQRRLHVATLTVLADGRGRGGGPGLSDRGQAAGRTAGP